jgi:hypothetical protein
LTAVEVSVGIESHQHGHIARCRRVVGGRPRWSVCKLQLDGSNGSLRRCR